MTNKIDVSAEMTAARAWWHDQLQAAGEAPADTVLERVIRLGKLAYAEQFVEALRHALGHSPLDESCCDAGDDLLARYEAEKATVAS